MQVTLTALNLRDRAVARWRVGPTGDVVMIEVRLESELPTTSADGVGAAYAAQVDWDPRHSEEYAFFVLEPIRLQAWREVNEIAGRELMRDGHWLV